MLDKRSIDLKIKEVREFVNKADSGFNKTYFIKTYGCQMNEHDSETLSKLLLDMGFEKAGSEEAAGLVLLNTCDIRENADNRFFGNLGILKARKEKDRSLIVAVCGCMMQRASVVERIRTTYPFVNIVFGTHNIYSFPALLYDILAQNRKKAYEVLEDNKDIVEGMGHDRLIKHKALVNITFGCDNFCTFCIVPYTRGREKSREPEAILSEIRGLIKSGVKEVYLLGQNVNSYGKSLKTGYNFANLLRDIAAIEGDFRIRFMTPHPKDFSDDVIKVIKEEDKIQNFIHLPLQAANSSLLKRMNRRYTKEVYLELVRKMRREIPDVALSTDLIIGFPGETEEDIDELIELIEEVRFDNAFTFIYSPREGTPAARFEDQIPEDVKHSRFDRMLKVLNKIIVEKNQALVGGKFRLLVDEREGSYLVGRTYCSRIVYFEGPDSLIGEFCEVEITDANKFSLKGRLIGA